MRKVRSPQETKELIEKIDQKIKEGMNIKQACIELGYNDSAYHRWYRNHGKKKKAQIPTLINIPVSTSLPENKLMVLVGSPQDIHQTLDKLILLNQSSKLLSNMAFEKFYKCRGGFGRHRSFQVIHISPITSVVTMAASTTTIVMIIREPSAASGGNCEFKERIRDMDKVRARVNRR